MILEYGNILLLLHICVTLTIETYLCVFQPLLHHRNAAIVGLVCRLLTGEGHETLWSYCPQFCGVVEICRRSYRLYTWDPGEHLRFVNPCNFKTSAKFQRSWLASAVTIWNDLPADSYDSNYTKGCATLGM